LRLRGARIVVHLERWDTIWRPVWRKDRETEIEAVEQILCFDCLEALKLAPKGCVLARRKKHI
jgi:hypothetical protein